MHWRDHLSAAQVTLFILFGLLVLASVFAFQDHWWIWPAAMVPAFLVFQHGIYLLISKPTVDPSADGGSSEETEPRTSTAERSGQGGDQPRSSDSRSGGGTIYTGTGDGGVAVRSDLREQAQEEVDRQFSVTAVALDYFFPTFLIFIAGIVPGYVLTHRPDVLMQLVSDEPVTIGALFGGLGAYVYVLLMLGQRSFQRDITPGAAVWSAVQLFLGPVLGGVTAAVIAKTVQLNDFAREVIFFFAGFAPREIVTFFANAVRRYMAGGQTPPKLRVIPLQSIHGINQAVEDRLFEEGITDGYLLAMADPIRLYRRTAFDLRQILAWMDECLLYARVPKYADVLQDDEGISGAIDLAYYWEMGPDGQPDKVRIHGLATRIKVDVGLMEDLIQRLDQDAQVQRIWSLYQERSGQ